MLLVCERKQSHPSVNVRRLAPNSLHLGPWRELVHCVTTRRDHAATCRVIKYLVVGAASLPSELRHQGFGHDQVGGVDQVEDVSHLVEDVWLYQSESSERRQ